MSSIMTRRATAIWFTVLAAGAAISPAASAQMVGGHEGHETVAPATAAHMRVTPKRTGSPADSARAAAIVAELTPAIAKFRDVRVAEGDGFKLFAPGVKGQRVYHYTNYRNAFREQFSAQLRPYLDRPEPDAARAPRGLSRPGHPCPTRPEPSQITEVGLRAGRASA